MNSSNHTQQQADHQPSRLFQTLRRSFHEFLKIPTLIIIGFLALTITTYLLDRTSIGWLQPVRQFMTRHVFGDPESTGKLLSAIAGSLITVASITFSLILLAIQQSAGSMTHQVIDQFLRRPVNRIFIGFFVGLAVFALITLATVNPPFNPVFGASLVLMLSIIALGLILVLIYSTLHQMRPAVVVEGIRELTLAARQRQIQLIAQTRAVRQIDRTRDDTVQSTESGYLVAIDLDLIINAVVEVSGEVEIELVASIGSFISFGDALAMITASDSAAVEHLSTVLPDALRLAEERSLDVDPAYGLEQLLNIAWTSISTSKQNPVPGTRVNHALRDILGRFASVDYTVERSPTSPVVYHDTVTEELFESFELLAVVSSESMQPQQYALVLETFTLMYGRVPPAWQERIEEAIRRILPALGDHVLTSRLDRSLTQMVETLQQHGRTEIANTVSESIQSMRATVGQLNSRATRVPPQ